MAGNGRGGLWHRLSSLASSMGLVSLEGNGGAQDASHEAVECEYKKRRRGIGGDPKAKKKDVFTGPDPASCPPAGERKRKAQLGSDGPAIASSGAPLPQSLLSVLECPVCMQVYGDRVLVCVNGHSICGGCMERLKDSRCPSCRVKMGEIRNRVVEQMVKTAVLPCVYREHGCGFTAAAEARKAHEAACPHRPMPCLLRRCYPSCNWHGPPSALVAHLNTHCNVRVVRPGVVDDVYWSYGTDQECFQRGKDAAYYLPWCHRFYYVSISKRGDAFYLAALWVAISPRAAIEDESRRIQMELVFPLDGGQSITYTLLPQRLLPGQDLDREISTMIDAGSSFIVPIKRWRHEWSETKNKCYFQIRARWSEAPRVASTLREHPKDVQKVGSASDADGKLSGAARSPGDSFPTDRSSQQVVRRAATSDT